MIPAWLGQSRYVAEIACLTNDSVIATLYVIADVTLAAALLAIAARLFHFLGREYVLLSVQVRLAFIVAGLIAAGYLIHMLVLFEGAYRLEVVMRGMAAGFAVVLAITFWTAVRPGPELEGETDA